MNLIFSEGKYCRLHCRWLLCSFHVVGFQIDVPWSHWGSVLACSQFGFLGVVPYWIRILGMRFLFLAMFVILHHFSVRFGHVGNFVSFPSWSFMKIRLMSLLRLLPDNLWDWWKYWICFLRSVSCSSGVKTWHFQFIFLAAAWGTSLVTLVGSFWDPSGTWFCLSSLLCRGGSQLAALATKLHFSVEWFVFPHVSQGG